jgi:hypothetical protein
MRNLGFVYITLIPLAFSEAAAQTAPETAIMNLATTSTCARHEWRDRGSAPIGYIRGIALTYRKAYCDARANGSAATRVATGALGQPGIDALAHYGLNPATDLERLRAVYTLMIGLGMRESSGNTTEGRDVTVANPTAANAEAGLFQTSYDSLTMHPALAATEAAYGANPGACNLAVFRVGARDRNAPLVGTGPGAEFQRFNKACPSYAAEYTSVLMRVNRRHWGPINTRKAEYLAQCQALLAQVETVAPCP